MTRQELEQACQPQTPEETLEGLKELYDVMANSPGWASEDDLTTLNSGIEVMKKVIAECE